MLTIALVALQVAAAVPAKDSARIFDDARSAEYSFFRKYNWFAWMTFRLRKPDAPPEVNTRGGCVQGATVGLLKYDPGPEDGVARNVNIPGLHPRSICVGWVSQKADSLPDDEALTPDNFLRAAFRDSIKPFRDKLLRALDAAAAKLPGDAWIAGQRVRFYLDSRLTFDAKRAATDCRAAAWWCASLRGYARYRAGEFALADREFLTSLKAMPDSVRCSWNDLAPLLVWSGREPYSQLNCAGRDSANATIWWLGDPSYLQPGNERRSEHLSRRVFQQMLDDASQLQADADEFLDWTTPEVDKMLGPLAKMNCPFGEGECDILAHQKRRGRHQFGEAIIRYGWPTSSVWKTEPYMPNCDYDAMSSVLILMPCGMPTAYPGYVGPRYHTLPNWAAVVDPFHMTPANFDLGPKWNTPTVWNDSWWPQEFMALPNPLVDVPFQLGFFRRPTTTLAMLATQWDTSETFKHAPRQGYFGVVTTVAPDAIREIVKDTMIPRSAVRSLPFTVEARPQILGIEMVATTKGDATGRTRFGIDPPPPLANAPRDVIALSDILITSVAAMQDAPANLEDARGRMFGSTDLDNPIRVAAFWEVYGLKTNDSVRFQLRVVRQDTFNIARRFAATLHLISSGRDSVVSAWSEQVTAAKLLPQSTGPTIGPRGLVVNLSELASGSYSIEVIVTRRTEAPVTSRRFFTVGRH